MMLRLESGAGDQGLLGVDLLWWSMQLAPRPTTRSACRNGEQMVGRHVCSCDSSSFNGINGQICDFCGSPAVLQGDNMCLPALARSSSPVDKGKRIYGQGSQDVAASDWPGVTNNFALEHVWNVDEALWHIVTLCSVSSWYIMVIYHGDISWWYIYHAVCIFAGRRSSLLQDEAYAQQFDSAAGSHTGAQGPSSVRVYSHSDRDRLYEAWYERGLAKLGILGVSQISDIWWYLYIQFIYSSHIFNSSSIHVLFMHYSWSKFCQKWRCSNGSPNSHVLPRGLTIASMAHWWCAYAAITSSIWDDASKIASIMLMLEHVRTCWNMLEDVGRCWKMLEDVGRCRKMLEDG